MNKLRQILQFIRALLGFLLNLKKKEKDEKKEEVEQDYILYRYYFTW